MMRIGLGQFNFNSWGSVYGARRTKRIKPADPCEKVCGARGGSDVACAACQARGDLQVSQFSMYGQSQPLQGYYYPPEQVQLGMTPALGQGVTDSPNAMFVAGALTWAFFGPVIKSVLGLGASAASYGVDIAHGKLNKVKAGSGRKRLPPPSGSDDDED